MTRIGLLGCGSWGTTLAQILAKKGETVNAWHYRKDFVDAISESRVNPLLPDINLDEIVNVLDIILIVNIVLNNQSMQIREIDRYNNDAFDDSTLKFIEELLER